MSNKLEVLLRGEAGKIDGYLEIMLGTLSMTGMLLAYDVRKAQGLPGEDLLVLQLQLREAPLGHLGTADIEPVALSPEQQAKQDARAFWEMVRSESYLILDTETTGLDDGEICQIAVIDDRGKVLMYEYVQTVRKIPAEATRIHGITNEMVKGARLWAEVSHDLKKLLTGKNVVIYNAVYDRKMMHQSAEKAGLPKVEWKEFVYFWCAMETFAVIYGDWNEYRGNFKWQKLSSAAAYFHATATAQHDALGDCMTTLAVVEGIKTLNVEAFN